MSTAQPPADFTPASATAAGFASSGPAGPARAVDYWGLPEGTPIELIRGEFVVSPAPNSRHQVISMLLTEVVLRGVRDGGGFGAAAPIDVVFSDDTILQPDLVYVSKSRRSIVDSRVRGAPDLVIEILSASHAARDRTHKLAIYAQHGVAEYWIVDPAERHIEFLLLSDDPSEDQRRYRVELPTKPTYQSPRLPEIKIDLPTLWGEVEKLSAQ
ncbi:MAG: Uma2 family endonuclease [Planctomycetota bacterium]